MKAVIIFFCLAYLFYMWGCDPCNLESKSPNIVIILSDDVGYEDFERIGGSTETPSLNRLADEGVFFNNFYAAGPNCSPSRTGLMTGKNTAKVGVNSYRPVKHPVHLPAHVLTIA